jgi:hypothetical protein
VQSVLERFTGAAKRPATPDAAAPAGAPVAADTAKPN